MIDNLSFDPMKKISINLELYFESYKFSNFRDFFKFFLNFSEIFMIFVRFLCIKNQYLN